MSEGERIHEQVEGLIPMADNAKEIVEEEIMPLIDQAIEVAEKNGIPLVALIQSGPESMSGRAVFPNPIETALELVLASAMMGDGEAARKLIMQGARAAAPHDTLINVIMLKRMLNDMGLGAGFDIDAITRAAEEVKDGGDLEEVSRRATEELVRRAKGSPGDDLLDELLGGHD
jgi:hypothetical protein